MAKTGEGKKIVHVKGYKRTKPGGVKKNREIHSLQVYAKEVEAATRFRQRIASSCVPASQRHPLSSIGDFLCLAL